MVREINPRLSVMAVAALPAAADHEGQFRIHSGKLLWSDGAKWNETGGGMLYRKYIEFTSSQSWTFPATALPTIDYDVIGGGGAGENKSNNGSGGGGGDRQRGSINIVPGETISIVVGAPGVGATNAAGTNGGQSAIGNYVTADGGVGGNGVSGSTSGSGIAGLYYSNISAYEEAFRTLVTNSAPGAIGSNTSGTNLRCTRGGIGEDGYCSGGGAICNQSGSASSGGPGAGDGTTGTVAPDATRPGCGGGGVSGASPRRGGHGYRGEVRIWYWDTVP